MHPSPAPRPLVVPPHSCPSEGPRGWVHSTWPLCLVLSTECESRPVVARGSVTLFTTVERGIVAHGACAHPYLLADTWLPQDSRGLSFNNYFFIHYL